MLHYVSGAFLGGFTDFQKPVNFTELAYYSITLIKMSSFMDNILKNSCDTVDHVHLYVPFNLSLFTRSESRGGSKLS